MSSLKITINSIIILGLCFLILISSCVSKKKKPTNNIKPSIIVDADIPKEKDFYPIRFAPSNEKDKVIGHCDSNLNKEKPESLLGNLVADAVLDRAQTKMLDSLGLPVNFCVLNYNSLRASFTKGPITLENIYNVMPFDLKLSVVKLKGADVVNLFEILAKRGGDPISGLQITISDSGIYEFAFVNGRPFDSRRDYYIATSDFLAGGADQFDVFKNGVTVSTNLLLRDILFDYIQTFENEGIPVLPKIDGRFSIDK